MIRVSALLMVSALLACSIGPRANSFAPATGPEGVTADVQSRDTSFRAELLVLSDTGLLLLRGRTVVYAPYGAIRHASFDQLNIELNDGEPPDAKEGQRLRLLSRFPQGASAARIRALLAAYHQDSVVVLRR